MSSITVDPKKLLEAGAHFGHKTSRWHPAMRPFIHSKRGGNHIIDLTMTAAHLEVALEAVTKAVAGGGKVLVVSTKRQAVDSIQRLADDTNSPFVVNRWLGGMLTNQNTIGGRVKHLKRLEERMASGELAAKYGKLEVQRYEEEIEEMNTLYGGIKDMPAKPAILFVVDILHDSIAVKEAQKLNVPVMGLVDTNGDPRTISHPVPCNDDALKTIELVCDYVKQAIELGKSQQKAAQPDPSSVPPEVSAKKPAVAEAKPAPKSDIPEVSAKKAEPVSDIPAVSAKKLEAKEEPKEEAKAKVETKSEKKGE
ncbi:MAG: small subunit ribosomal protein S2 [Candidatus Saccharimonadales bacterium]|jgi:small subunit ribosomal protein S2